MMLCPHCLHHFAESHRVRFVGKDVNGCWYCRVENCAKCDQLNLTLINLEGGVAGEHLAPDYVVKSAVRIHPRTAMRAPCPTDVPADIAEDYREACLVLELSPKASAALSRRCLQHLLRHPQAAAVKHSDLSKEIQETLDSGKLPSQLAISVDAIRQIGNFSAHPMKDKQTGDILPVEPHEADWNLDVLEGLFDFYFVQPALTKAKIDALNAKLAMAGKPPMK